MNVWDRVIQRRHVVHVFTRDHNVLNVHVNRHCGRVREVSKSRLLGEHELGGSIIFVYLGSVYAKVCK